MRITLFNKAVVVSCVILILATAVFAADEPVAVKGTEAVWAKQQNIIYVNCAGFFIDQIFISYVRAIVPNFSIGANLLYSKNNSPYELLTSPPITPDPTYTYGAGFTVDYHIENQAPNGLYFGIGMNGAYTKPGDGYATWVFNPHIGYRWIFDWGISINVQAAAIIANDSDDYVPYLIGNNLNLGWAF